MRGGVRRSLAVTAVDKWLYFNAQEGATLDDFRRDLLTFESSPVAQAGTAGHAILEHVPDTVLESGGPQTFRDLFDMNDPELLDAGGGLMDSAAFDEEFPARFGGRTRIFKAGDYYSVTLRDSKGQKTDVELSFDMADVELRRLPVREMQLGKAYDTRLGPVWVSGIVDGFDAVEVLDYKFTGNPDLERLMETYQWRIYLDIANAQRFRWEIFTLKEPLKDETAWRVVGVQSLLQFRYPELGRDVARLVDETALAIERYAPEYWTRNERRAQGGG